MQQQFAHYNYILRLADNALVTSYRLSEWCSNAPLLEEDLALTNFALDYTGRAQLLFDYASKLEGKGRSADDLAYRRAERQFQNNLICELPNGDFAFTIARLFFYSTFELYHYPLLVNSADETIAAIAAKAIKEIKYLQAHAADWMLRLGDGTEESKRRLINAIEQLLPFLTELFEVDEIDQLLVLQAIAADISQIKDQWLQHVNYTMVEATLLPIILPVYGQSGGKQGVHTEYLGHILCEMQYLQRAYPDAIW